MTKYSVFDFGGQNMVLIEDDGLHLCVELLVLSNGEIVPQYVITQSCEVGSPSEWDSIRGTYFSPKNAIDSFNRFIDERDKKLWDLTQQS